MLDVLPRCRHRGERVGIETWRCHSPKVILPRDVTTSRQCALECPSVDHDDDPRFPFLVFSRDEAVAQVPVHPVRVKPRPELVAIAMITAPRNPSRLRESISEVRRAGFPQTIHLFAEPESDVERLPPGVRLIQHTQKLGCWGNWRTAAEFLLDRCDEPFLLIFEDDIRLSRNAALGLQHAIDTELHDDWGLLSLYTPHHNVEGVASRPGWQHIDLGSGAWGSLAYCFTRESLRAILEISPPKLTQVTVHPDCSTSAAASKLRRRCLYHVPSLCDHTGFSSTLGHTHIAACDPVRFSHDDSGYVPDSTRRMPGKLAIVTTHFNPCGYEALRRNYRRFAEHVADSGGELWTIEVALGESPCFLPPGPHIVQLRSDSVLWHKEAALNSLIERLPPEYDKVAWIDADVLFDRADWIHAIRRELEKVPVIQCFSEAILLDAEGRVECRLESIVKRASAFPSNPFSSAGGYGYAWAARRSAIEQTGLFALDMAGGGDTFMTLGWLDRRDHPLLPVISPELRTSFEEWSERAWPHVFGGVGWIDGAVRHLFHGSAGNRQHYERAGCLADHRFDPNVHLERDADGLVRWTEAGRTLERDIAKFFRIRREDDQLADDAIRRPVLQTFEFEDCLRRAEVVVRMPKPKARCCVATIATSGFEKWLERMLASLAKNGQIDDALRVVFVPESDLENRRIAERYGAVPVLCRPRLGCDSAIKSVLYSAPLAIDAELFLCLDADIVVFGELESLFAKVASNPGRISIVRNSGQPAYNSLREMVATFYRGQVVDLDRLCPGGSRHADFPLVVNDGVFASDRATLLAVDSCLRQMPAAADYVDEHHVRNQLLFNLALAELDCSLEMPARYNVQLHSDRIEMRSTPSGMRPFHDGKPVRLLHFTGESKRTSPFRDIDF